ncbi:MAG: DUF711 family protein [Thermoplasmata archaeon]|nr:DUF711 family protein [Thermoplasmata archaeon]
MPVRTITTGVNLSWPIDLGVIEEAAAFNARARDAIEATGVEVQSTRVVTQPWVDYMGARPVDEIVDAALAVEGACVANGVDFISLGAVPGSHAEACPHVVAATERVSLAVSIADGMTVDRAAVDAAARAIVRIGRTTDRGVGNFRFGATANCPPDIPFFPAASHEGDMCFMLGMECGQLVYQAFDEVGTLDGAGAALAGLFEERLAPVENAAVELATREGVRFNGIDVSTAPGLTPEGSVAFAFERLGIGMFGAPGTLAVAATVTGALKRLHLRTCGYSGLMLPLLEDAGLVQRFDEGVFGLENLLLYSTVCGTGLDAVPLPGDVAPEKVAAILLDVAALAVKLDKPLSARLLPFPDGGAGERTDFRSEHLLDCTIPDIQ